MKLFFIALLSSLSLSTCLPAFAANLPARVNLSYSLKVSGMSAEVKDAIETKRVRGAGSSVRGSYTITSEARAKGALALLQQGSIARSSRGMVTNKGLQPLRFSDRRGNRQPAVAIFEWAKKLLTLQHKGNEQQTTLPVGTQDRLSMFYNFAFSAAPLIGKTLELHETDGRSLSLFRYTVSGKEILDTPMGKLETIVLTKRQEHDDLRGRKIWLATAHHMLPVRILATEKDGGVLDQMITQISYQ